jgi:hypothetical protein
MEVLKHEGTTLIITVPNDVKQTEQGELV